MSRPRHLAFFRVSAELLEQALQLPKGSTIHRVLLGDEWSHPGTVSVLVENVDFPEVLEAVTVPEVQPTLYRERRFVLGWKEVVRWVWGKPLA